MALRVLRCAIEEVAQWHPELFLEPHIVGCVAVLSQYSDSPAGFDVECEDLDARWLRGATTFGQKCIYLSVAGHVEFVEGPKHETA
jgi:hypothetical protein